MIVGVLGLGLIGGSFAKVYHAAGHTVYACEIDRSILDFAVMDGVVAAELTEENISECDLVLLVVPPAGIIDFVRRMAPHIGTHPLVLDCCGVKREVCSACFPLAEEYGFTFVGGHPMAGTQYAGYRYSKASMFHNAPMVIVPPVYDDILLLDRVKELLAPAGFARVSVTTAEDHDEMICFTSQMIHILSNAYIKSPTARGHKGFSAGSYKDMTRVAWLDPNMWSELLLDNRDNLLRELDFYLNSLSEYRAALIDNDRERMRRLLADGRRCKEEVDGR